MGRVLTRKVRSLVLNAKRRCASLVRVASIRLFYGDVQVPWSTVIGRNVVLQATDGGRVVLGSGVSIGAGSQLVAQGGTISIGRDSFIGIGCVLTSKIGLSIGRDALIAEYVTIRDQDHRFPIGKRIRESGFDCTPVLIGDDVWVGAKSTVLRGAKVGTGAVIGAHSLVRGGGSREHGSCWCTGAHDQGAVGCR